MSAMHTAMRAQLNSGGRTQNSSRAMPALPRASMVNSRMSGTLIFTHGHPYGVGQFSGLPRSTL
jgi:hypothetical protein